MYILWGLSPKVFTEVIKNTMRREECRDESGKLQFTLTICAHVWVLLLNVKSAIQW